MTYTAMNRNDLKDARSMSLSVEIRRSEKRNDSSSFLDRDMGQKSHFHVACGYYQHITIVQIVLYIS